jgi:hypothetical protein
MEACYNSRHTLDQGASQAPLRWPVAGACHVPAHHGASPSETQHKLQSILKLAGNEHRKEQSRKYESYNYLPP